MVVSSVPPQGHDTSQESVVPELHGVNFLHRGAVEIKGSQFLLTNVSQSVEMRPSLSVVLS